MKHLCIFFLLSFFSTGLWGQASAAPKKGRVEVVFNNKMKFDDLVKTRTDLAAKGISLQYSELEFDKNGGLVEIDFKVDCKDGFGGGAAKGNLNNKRSVGFYRDYDNKAAPFGTTN